MKPELSTDAEILDHIERFCAEQNMGVTTFGRNAISDPNLVANLRNGRSLTIKTARAVLDFMAQHETETPSERAA